MPDAPTISSAPTLPLTTITGEPLAARNNFGRLESVSFGLLPFALFVALVLPVPPLLGTFGLTSIFVGFAGLMQGLASLRTKSLTIRLEQSDTILCLRCAQPTTQQGDFSHCPRCRQRMRTDIAVAAWRFVCPAARRLGPAGGTAKPVWRRPPHVRTRPQLQRFVAASICFALAVILLIVPIIYGWTYHWLVTVPAVIGGITLASAANRRHVFPENTALLCGNCNYPLDNLTSTKCPECGYENSLPLGTPREEVIELRTLAPGRFEPAAHKGPAYFQERFARPASAKARLACWSVSVITIWLAMFSHETTVDGCSDADQWARVSELTKNTALLREYSARARESLRSADAAYPWTVALLTPAIVALAATVALTPRALRDAARFQQDYDAWIRGERDAPARA